jgi:hypothetical protein
MFNFLKGGTFGFLVKVGRGFPLMNEENTC